jgi:hypothetical protein
MDDKDQPNKEVYVAIPDNPNEDVCKYCHSNDDPKTLILVCDCKMKVHQDCINNWVNTRTSKNKFECEICKKKFNVVSYRKKSFYSRLSIAILCQLILYVIDFFCINGIPDKPNLAITYYVIAGLIVFGCSAFQYMYVRKNYHEDCTLFSKTEFGTSCVGVKLSSCIFTGFEHNLRITVVCVVSFILGMFSIYVFHFGFDYYYYAVFLVGITGLFLSAIVFMIICVILYACIWVPIMFIINIFKQCADTDKEYSVLAKNNENN